MNAKEVLLKKKLFGFSLLIHLSILLFAMTSYMTIEKKHVVPELEQVNFIEIQFSNSSKSSGMGSTKKSVENQPKEKATARSIEEKIIKVEPLEEAETKIVVEKPELKVSKSVSEVENNENSKTEGDSDEGEMLSGSALGSLEFDGEGVFGRKVIYHAPIKNIAEMDGRIAINIGINRKGNVVGAAINKEKSTIKNKDLLIKALEMVLKYRFETDYSAPKIQYGKFTFIFDLSKN